MNTQSQYPGHHILDDAGPMAGYSRWVINMFKDYWGKDILEIGSGIGTMSALLPAGASVTLTETDPAYISVLRKKFDFPVYRWDAQNPPPRPLSSSGFDVVFTANVLEHIPDHRAVLKSIFKLLRPGGRLLIYVPAKQIIFGTLDQALGHCRRYEKDEFIKLLSDLKFSIITARYCNLPGFFGWWVVGKILRLHRSRLLAKVFDIIFTPWLYFEERLSLPFGQNLIVVAAKPDHTSSHTPGLSYHPSS